MGRFTPDDAPASSGGHPGSMEIYEGPIAVEIIAADTIATATDSFAAVLEATFGDTVAGQTETGLLEFAGMSDTNTTPTETVSSLLRYWSATCTDNDSSRTTPTNAQSANNGTFAVVSTNLSLGDLTNPVTLTGSAFGVPTSLAFTVTAKRLRLYHKQAAGTLGLDTATLAYNVGAGPVTLATYASNVAVDNSASGITYDVSGLTLTQLNAITMTCSYQASEVATPSTSHQIDAWCVELDVTL